MSWVGAGPSARYPAQKGWSFCFPGKRTLAERGYELYFWGQSLREVRAARAPPNRLETTTRALNKLLTWPRDTSLWNLPRRRNPSSWEDLKQRQLDFCPLSFSAPFRPHKQEKLELRRIGGEEGVRGTLTLLSGLWRTRRQRLRARFWSQAAWVWILCL